MSGDIDTLVEMGFSRGKVLKAWKAVNGAGLQPAMDWLLNHPEVTDEPEEEENHGQTLSAESTTSTAIITENEEGEIKDGEQTAQSLVCNICKKLFRDAATAQRHAIKTEHQDFSESTEVIKPLTEEEKKQKLAELKTRLAEKRALQAKDSVEEQKQAERIRRKAGQDMTAVKEELESKEIKKAFDQKKKEKELERIAKAKVKAQIEQDKLERQAKREAAKKQAAGQSQTSNIATTTTTTTPAAIANKPIKTSDYTDARLQIRIPNQAPVTHTFSADASLTDVIDHLKNLGCNNPFTLSTTFPRKTFGESDEQKTLKELNLVPSSALVLTYV